MNSSTSLLAASLNGPDTSNLTVNQKRFTDTQTAANGTAALFSATNFAPPIISATNGNVTTTNAATVNISGAPIAGTNQTLTNSYGLYCNANALFNASTYISASLIASSNTFTGALSNNGQFLSLRQPGLTDNVSSASSTNTTNWAADWFQAPTISATNANVTYNGTLSTMAIVGAPKPGTNATFTGNVFALNVQSGLSNFSGGYLAPGNAAAKVSGSTTSQNINVSAYTTIKFPAVVYDRTNIYNTSTGAFVLTQTGVYRFGIQIVQTTASQNNYYLVVNGTTVANLSQKGTGAGNDPAVFCFNGTTDHYVTAGSSVTLQSFSATTIYCQDSQTSQFYCTLIS